MRTTLTHGHTQGLSHLGHGVGHAVHEMVQTLHVWQERARARRQLAELDDHMLQDIGIDRDSLEHEIDKPFWRA
ncbi:MAG: DUF1127 domain-containing protein [Rhodospirillaceae bacterium]|nr:DUF1127 domain-containing protein [Rhodospirillaceae bacterium]